MWPTCRSRLRPHKISSLESREKSECQIRGTRRQKDRTWRLLELLWHFAGQKSCKFGCHTLLSLQGNWKKSFKSLRAWQGCSPLQWWLRYAFQWLKRNSVATLGLGAASLQASRLVYVLLDSCAVSRFCRYDTLLTSSMSDIWNVWENGVEVIPEFPEQEEEVWFTHAQEK